MLLGRSLVTAIDFYWTAFSKFKNALEDIEGADGRQEYLLSLRYKLVEALQQMDAALSEPNLAVKAEHRLSFALEHGLKFLDMDGITLVKTLRLDEPEISYEDLHQCLLAFGDSVISQLPGEIPDALGSAGHREVLRAMRGWSKAAAETGDDLGFLAARLNDL